VGLSNKIGTKIRTAAKTEVVPLPRPYLDAGALVAGAVLRAAASTIGQLRLTSYTSRGRDFMGIRQAGSSYLSTISVTQQGQGTWSVTLGVQTVSGWAVDWQVKVVLEDGPAGVTASLTTPMMLTLDGTLANKSAHGELRDLVLSGLRAGQLPGGTAEVTVSQAGLAAGQIEPFYAAIAVETLRTRLRPGEVMTALVGVPFPVADRQPGGLRWRLGAAGALAGRFAEARIGDDGAARTVELRCPEQSTGSAVIDVMAAKRGTALFSSVERAVRRLDPDAERTAEPVSTVRPAAG
jgi:hypothetical protein